MNNWDKLKILSLVISSIIIPIVVGYIGHAFTQAITEREIQGKFVEPGFAYWNGNHPSIHEISDLGL